jgi:hypothetical protein
VTARRDKPENLEAPEPEDKPDVVALGPGQIDHSFTLQAIMTVQRELGGLGAKLDRVIEDNADQGRKLDELRHQVTFVRGAIAVVGILAAIVGWLVANKVHVSFGEGDAPRPVVQAR